jgi:L-fucose mutarotase/ribose pyranase (RbsD/FucU family)
MIQRLCWALAGVLLMGGCATRTEPSPWGPVLDSELRAMGYRNWIVVGDSAFPIHSRRGVRTLLIDGEIPEVLEGVLQSLENAQKVSPRIYTGRELRHVPNDKAPGVENYRKALEKAMHGHPVREMDYRSLSTILEDSSKSFAVLVLKTKTSLPYSSVFIELDTAYWDGESEREMRNKMQEKELKERLEWERAIREQVERELKEKAAEQLRQSA